MIQKGYLRGLATSVHWDDEALQKTLLHIPEPLKSLYVYESKMVRVYSSVCMYVPLCEHACMCVHVLCVHVCRHLIAVSLPTP